MAGKRKKSVFYRIYGIIVGLFLIVLAAALTVGYLFMQEYEKQQPTPMIENFVNTTLGQNDLYALCERGLLTVSPYETRESVNAAFASWRDDRELKILFTARTPDGCDSAYAVLAGEEKLLLIGLRRQETAGRFGLRGYDIAAASITGKRGHSVTLHIPEDAQVTLNGVEMTGERVNEPLPTVDTGLLKEPAIHHQTCTVKGLLNAEPAVRVTVKGHDLKVTQEKNVYTAESYLTAAEKKAVKEEAIAATEAYAAYMQNDLPLSEVAPHFDISTVCYQNIRASLVEYARPHISYAFKDVACTEYHRYSNEIYCCRVYFKQVLHNPARDYVDVIDKYIYLRHRDGVWKVVDMQMSGS